MREEGARVQGAVLSSFAMEETKRVRESTVHEQSSSNWSSQRGVPAFELETI